MKTSSSERDQKRKGEKKESILQQDQMLRIPMLVLFKMLNEKFSFFIFSHLSFSCQKKKKRKPSEGRTPCGTLQRLLFISCTWDIKDPVSKCRKNDRVHTALVWSLLKYSQCCGAHKRCGNPRGSSEVTLKLKKQTFLERCSGDVSSLVLNGLRGHCVDGNRADNLQILCGFAGFGPTKSQS